MKSPHEHNQDIQRQVEKRLQEMDDQINAIDQPVYQTQKHQLEQSQKPWLRKVILGGKLFALAVATLVAVRVASVLAGVVIFGALAFLVYKLFLESKIKNFK
jgi:Flp pilus assembly protein TadB